MSFTGLFTPDRQPRDRFVTLTRHSDDDREFILSRPERERIAREAIHAVARRGRIDDGDIQHILSQTVDQRGLSVTDIMVRAASLAEQYTGRVPFNWSAANRDQIARYLATLGLEPGWRRAMRDAERANRTSSERTRDGDDDHTASSFHHDETFLRSPAGREMQAYAREHGLEWAANRADVLRLGREAIQLFARTQFRRESFDGLQEVGFTGQQIARLARFAERTGQDANEVARITRDSVRMFGGNDEAERRRWRDMLDAFHDNPHNAHQDLDEKLHRMERTGTTEQQEQARRQRELVERARQTEADAAARAERDAAERARQEAERAAREAATDERRTATLFGPRPAPETPPSVAAPPPAAEQPPPPDRPPPGPTAAAPPAPRP